MRLDAPEAAFGASWFYIGTNYALDDPHGLHEFFLDDGTQHVGMISLSETHKEKPEHVLRAPESDYIWTGDDSREEARAYEAYVRFRRDTPQGRAWTIAGKLADLRSLGMDSPTVGMVEQHDLSMMLRATTSELAALRRQLLAMFWLLLLVLLCAAWVAWNT